MRERAALFDQTSFSKFEVTGPGALAALQRIAANDLDRPIGTCVYTQLCNEKGGIEADLTIMRLAEDRFYVVTGSHSACAIAAGSRGICPPTARRDPRRDLGLCRAQHRRPGARDILQAATDDDVSNAAFPYLTVREIEIGLATGVRAARVGYVGELGWELHVPTEYAAHVYERLMEAGDEHGTDRRRLSRHRSLPAGEGLCLLVGGRHARHQSLRGRARLRGGARQGRFHRPRRAREDQGGGPARRLATLTVDGFAPLHRRRDDPRRRRGRRHDDQRRLRLHGRQDDRASATCRPSSPGAALRDRGLWQELPATRGAAQPL